MSERMTEERWDWLRGLKNLRPLQREEVVVECGRARASEDAKDKEIERLKADNARLFVLLMRAEQPHEKGCPGTGKPFPAPDCRCQLDEALAKPHPGTDVREELTRLRAQVDELRRNRDSADADFAALSYALATRGAQLPKCRSAGGIVIASTVRDLRAQVATLITGQQRNGEARQQARLDMAHELAEMEPAARDTTIRRIIDRSEDKP